MRNKILIAIGLVGLMVSCIEEVDINNPIPTPGQEIQFSADLGSPKTRTLYGTESDGAVKVNWVNGDLISVYGTTCAVKQAEYSVKASTAATPNGTGQNFADDLTKTGAAGVQWGEATTADFYAVYPSVSGDITPTADGNGVVVPASIATQQYNEFKVNGNVIQGIPFSANTKAYGMDNALMYACTPGAVSTDESGNPKKVDLRFKPYSTVLKFTIPSWEGKDNFKPSASSKIVVKSITLKAPANIAGNFELTIHNDGTASAAPGSSSAISIVPAGNLEWGYGKTLEFSVFAIPLSEQNLSDVITDDNGEVVAKWEVAIEVENDNAKRFTLTPKDAQKAKLAMGEIHKLNLSSGFKTDAEWEYSPESWLTTVPRNVYISDLSLPGAWYATDSGYQGTATLDGLYKAGIRAFNIDCRLTLRPGLDVDNISNSSTYVDNLEHVSDEKYKDNDDATRYGPHTLVLACAGTEEYETRLSFATGKVTNIKKSVKEALIELGEYAALNTNEYIEVILTIAQKPKDFDHVLSSLYTFGTINPKMVLAAIAQTLNDDDVKGYLYGGTNGEVITPNTTINDVRGKVVVKVNMNTSDANIRAYNYSAPMLISEGSMASTSIGYTDAPVMVGVFDSMNTASMYWSDDYPTPDDNIAPMKYYYHQAQATSSAPTVAQRKAAILDILTKSYEIYKNNTHDAMFQIGIGGWTGTENNTSPSNLSKELNPYVYGIINSMLTGVGYDANGDGTAEVFTPAPVGAVLMNFATSTDNRTQQLIKAIIDLNGKYFLNSDITKPAWPTDGSGSGEGELD